MQQNASCFTIDLRRIQQTSLLCPTLREDNKTYYAKAWIKNDDILPWIKKLSELVRFLKVLFIIDDIIVNKGVFNRRQSLLELSTSGRHRGHYLWLLRQSYFSIPKKLSEQAKAIFVCIQRQGQILKKYAMEMMCWQTMN